MITGREKRIESYREVTVFRLIQELLNNAVEYGRATSVQIGLDMGESLVRVSVDDNGGGFELGDTLTSPELEQLGLATMRERVEMLGGQIHFDSGLGRGMKVSFEMPVS